MAQQQPDPWTVVSTRPLPSSAQDEWQVVPPPKPTPGILRSDSPFFGGTRGQAAADAAQRMLTNPENRSTFGAMLGGPLGGAAGGALIGGPVGAIGGAMLGAAAGGALGSVSEGKSVGDAMQEGAGEALWEAATPIVGGVGRLANAASRTATYHALRPSEAVLGQMRDAAGNLFRTPGESAKAFKYAATDLLDEVPGVPGGVRFAHGVQDIGRDARQLKLEALANSPATATTDEIVPPGVWDPLMTRLSGRSGSAQNAGKEVDAAIREALGVSVPQPSRVGPGARPQMSTPTIRQEWTMPQLDERLQGLQEALDNMFVKRNTAAMSAERAHPTAEEEALNLIRHNMVETMGAKANAASTGQSIPELNEIISRNIPMAQAATEATMPATTEGLPRFRLGGGVTNPTVQAFSYFGQNLGKATAKPLRLMGRTAQETAPLTPDMLRLLTLMVQQRRTGGQE